MIIYLENLLKNAKEETISTFKMSAELSLTLFCMGGAVLLFVLPKLIGDLTEHNIANLIIKRSCWLIAFYLLVMIGGFMLTIAQKAGYGSGEISVFMFIFGLFGYLMLIGTLFKTLFDIIELWKANIKAKRGIE